MDNNGNVLTDNLGNNFTAYYNFTIAGSCCPATPQNWNYNMGDYCWVNTMCNLTGYNITFSGAGNLTVNSTIYVNEIKNLSSGMTVWMKPDGLIYFGVN